MSIPMRTFQSLLGNNPQPRTEPKLVGPAPMHPTKEDKLNGNDLVMDPHNRIGSPTTSNPVTELFGIGKKKLMNTEKKVIAKPLTDAQLRKAQSVAKSVLNNPKYKVYKKAFAFDTMEKVKETGQFSDGSYAVAYVDLWKAWPNLRVVISRDNTIADLQTSFENDLNVELNKSGMRGTTQGGDWDTTFLYIFNLDTVLENYHGSAEEKLPKDTTGYPTNNEPVLVDTQGIGAVIGVEEGLSVYGNQMILDEIKNVLTGATMEGIDSNLVERFTELYRYQLEHVEEYPDLPVVRQFDHMIQHVINESVETNDLKLRVMTLQDDLMKGVQKANFEAGFCPNQRNLNELTPMDPTMRMQSYPTYPAEACERSCARLIDNIIFAKDDEELTEAFMILARMEQLVNEQYSVCEGVIIERSTSMAARSATRSATRKIANTSRKVKTSVKKALDPMEKFIENTMTKAKKADSEERRKIILRGGVVAKITRWLKRAIPIAAGLVVGKAIPVAAVLSAIAFLGWIATDKALDHREKAKILKELDDEIEIVNEKIEDARGDSNKQKKYELMRIRNKLNRTRDNVKLNLGSKVVGRLPEDNAIGHNKK